MKREIRNSAKALIMKNGKMLAVKLKDAEGVFYIMPGGGQEAGELLPQTVCREVAEELGIRVTVHDLAFVVEGAQGEAFHRVDLVFQCEYLEEIPGAKLHGDTHQIGFDWLSLSDLNTTPLYPSRLRRQIMNLYEGKPYKRYLGNEETGDPEWKD
jgi:8-oxo-dGTP pyrophosphatase MutT (NUDIX family)